MSTLKAYNIDSGDTTNLVIKTNGTEALTINGSTQAVSASGTIADGTAVLRPFVSLTSQATTSGTQKDFTGIPSWAKRITVLFNGVSTSGTSGLLVRLGGVSGFATTGYVGGSFQQDADLSATSGLPVRIGLATDTVSGIMTICNVTGNTWVSQHACARGSVSCAGGGSLSLSETLTQIRVLTLNGTDTFDAGSVNILYE